MPDNETILRDMYDAFNRGDIAAALAGIDQRFEAQPPQWVPDEHPYLGHDGIVRLFITLLEPWEQTRFEPREFSAAGDCVLVVVRQEGRERETGAQFEEDIFHLWTLRDGRAVGMRLFNERSAAEAALAAA